MVREGEGWEVGNCMVVGCQGLRRHPASIPSVPGPAMVASPSHPAGALGFRLGWGRGRDGEWVAVNMAPFPGVLRIPAPSLGLVANLPWFLPPDS